MNREAAPAKNMGFGKASSRCMFLFTKVPEKGKVKTRLSTHFKNDEITLNLYKCFVADLIENLKVGKYTLVIAFYPAKLEDKVISWLGVEHSYTPQVGRHLGKRMENVFREAFLKGFSEVLVIGSDIPDLTPSVIDKAFNALRNHDAVIGPCVDGGYYLIGFKKKTFLPYIFRNIQWSTEEVFRKTMTVFSRHGYKVHMLPELRDIDIDRIEDLRAFYKESKKKRGKYSKTPSYLSSIEDVLGYED
ncbi:MAG: TIGR04282 family arsenosugar biosynthesis glycosyltransferase [Nitrospirota bacterium]